MRRLFVPAVVVAALALGACSAPDRTPVLPTPSSASPAAPPSTKSACPPAATASYQPLSSVPRPGSMPAGSLEATIAKRGRLVVGVSADTRLLGARNLKTNQFEGFDIEMARQVARAIFGDASKVQFRAISAAQRIPFLNQGADAGGVDLVARAMTMTCARWSDVAFAGPYFMSYLRLLVRQDEAAGTVEALGAEKAKQQRKARVCATNGTTTLDRVRKVPDVEGVGVALTTDCMVLWQQGQVDAIAADDAILAGLAAQDPSAKIVGPLTLESEPYGLAVAKSHPEFVRFLNAVLEQMRRDGTWRSAYAGSGLGAVLRDRSQPAGNYSRPLP
jgi:polar amino acid transport system substrate-binding protein